MKKLTLVTLMLAVGLVSMNCLAWTVTVDQTVTNVNPTMLVPTVDNAPDSWAQRPNRDLVANANKAVVQGEIYRIGRQTIVAANSGNITSSLSTNVVTVTNVVGAATNVLVSTNITLTATSVPVSGLSAADGTVYWYRTRPATDTHLRLSILSSANGSLTLKNGKGDLLEYGPAQYSIAYTGTSTGATETNTLVFASTSAPAYRVVDLDGVTGPIYGYTSGVAQTNVVNAMSW